MTASERAQRLVAHHRLTTALLAVCDTTETAHDCDNANAALLAYVARLEACVEAARSVVDAELHTDLPYDEALDELRNRLAALDRPEDGETK